MWRILFELLLVNVCSCERRLHNLSVGYVTMCSWCLLRVCIQPSAHSVHPLLQQGHTSWCTHPHQRFSGISILGQTRAVPPPNHCQVIILLTSMHIIHASDTVIPPDRCCRYNYTPPSPPPTSYLLFEGLRNRRLSKKWLFRLPYAVLRRTCWRKLRAAAGRLPRSASHRLPASTRVSPSRRLAK